MQVLCGNIVTIDQRGLAHRVTDVAAPRFACTGASVTSKNPFTGGCAYSSASRACM
jgi:hypothetical protein